MNIYIDEATERRLFKVASETGRDIEDLARSAVEEAALEHFRHRSDDPAKPPQR
jgi:hypothetical protein